MQGELGGLIRPGPDEPRCAARRFERKVRDAARLRLRHGDPMRSDSPIDDDMAWAAFARRDRTQDGRFVGAVRTTGIYCRPSCPARHPRRENVTFFANGAVASAAGFRACLRCAPDDVSREEAALARAYALLRDAAEAVPLKVLAAAVDYSPHHFHRLFSRATGVTPAEYQRARRTKAMEDALDARGTITDAIYAGGYAAPARFYVDAANRLGMAPSAWRDGGRGEVIRWATADTILGTMLIAATARGICRLAFLDNKAGLDDAAGCEAAEAVLASRFPHADIRIAGAEMAELVARAMAAVAAPERPHDLPLDVAGTAFQEAVWVALARVPPGESLSYAQLAAAAGQAGAARAAGSACGANPVAVLIPCHRARRGDGSAGGYAWGLERKAALLRREGGSLL